MCQTNNRKSTREDSKEQKEFQQQLPEMTNVRNCCWQNNLDVLVVLLLDSEVTITDS